jgi:hypothetical protein
MEELAVQQYGKRGKMQSGTVFDHFHCTGEQTRCGKLSDGAFLEAGWDSSVAL